MVTLRPHWNVQGPLDLVLPIDPDPCPGFDWEAAYFMGQAKEHQDSQDRLNADRTWGTDNPAAPGGTGIAFAYSQPDLPAVRVACKGWKNNPYKPDVEHSMRDGIYYMAGFEMTHEVYFARGVRDVAERCTTFPWFSLHGDVVLDSPASRPQNLDCLLARAQGPDRNTGLRFINLRAFGNALYWKAALHKCARVLGAPEPTEWMSKALDIMEFAAVPTTGQISSNPGDAQHPLDQPNCEYTFHWSFAAMGALACSRRLHLPPPSWIEPHLDQLAALPPMDYYGGQSIPAFTYSDGGVLKVATGSGQQGDPNFGWLGTVNAVMYRETGKQKFKDRVRQYGPTANTDEVARKFTMVQRGMNL